MELEKQVVSLELARKLKTLGVKQDSHYVHYFNENLKYFVILPNLGCDKSVESKYCSAFTVAELGEMLPVEITDTNEHYYLWYRKINSKEWYVSYSHRRNEWCLSEKVEDTLADAMAKMLIYLIENKHVEAGKL